MQQLTVLHINKFHYLRGGSETIYFETAKLLESHGHKSIFFSMRHPENIACYTSDYFVSYIDFNKINSLTGHIKAIGRVLYSLEAKKCVSRLLKDRHPVDIAHLHNIHHQISPSILHELRKRKIPIVMTLHDYKMVCASYNMLVHERPCEVCARGQFQKAIKHKCLKDSFVKSALSAIEMYLHHTVLDIYNNVDIFISPSIFLKDKLWEMGFRKEIVYLPNFIDIHKFDEFEAEADKDGRDKESSFVYFGRLTHGKGLVTLLEAAKLLSHRNRNNKIQIKIIGDGLLREELEKKVEAEGISNVRFFGYMNGKALYQEIKKSMAAILPSEWYENSPMSVIEAFVFGKPVIGSRIAGIPELVRDNETGLTVEPGNPEDLSSKIEYLVNNPDKTAEMGENARRFVEQNLNAEKYYQKLMEVYKRAIQKNRSRK